jgi:hypothetical protein
MASQSLAKATPLAKANIAQSKQSSKRTLPKEKLALAQAKLEPSKA